MPRDACAHCGLPVSVGVHRLGAVYCCYGCFIVSRIVGSRDGRSLSAWSILRLAVGALLSMNVMMLALLMYTDSVEPHLHGPFRWVMMALSAPAMVLLGQPFVIGAWQEVRRRRLSLDTLIAVGSLSAFGVSAGNTIAGGGQTYFDTATMLLTLVTFGKLIEAGAKTRTHDLLCSLQSLLPETACRLDDSAPVEVTLDEIRPGDHLLVRPGERIAADGEVLSGRSMVEEATFTGEWQPR